MTDALVAKVVDAAMAGPRHSPLYEWMWRHHAALSRQLSPKPNWSAMAKVFCEAGLHDRTGKPATPKIARQTWARVTKAVARAQSARPAARPAPSPLRWTPRPDEVPIGVVGTRVEPASRGAVDQPADDQVARALADLNRGQEWMPGRR